MVFLCLFPYAAKNDSIKMKVNKTFGSSLCLVSSCALLFSVAQPAKAGGTTGNNGGYYYFTYYTGNGTTSISFPTGGGNFVGPGLPGSGLAVRQRMGSRLDSKCELQCWRVKRQLAPVGGLWFCALPESGILHR